MDKKARSTPARVIFVLMIIILILLAIILYTFLIKPSINSYVIKKQTEAKDIVLSTILQQLQTQGYVQITDQNGNAVLLVPVTPEQLAQVQGRQTA